MLRSVEDRLWLPNQIAHEFLNDRLKVISDVRAGYAGLREQLTAAREDAGSEESKSLLGSSAEYFSGLEDRFPKPSNSLDEDGNVSAVGQQ